MISENISRNNFRGSTSTLVIVLTIFSIRLNRGYVAMKMVVTHICSTGNKPIILVYEQKRE